MKVFIIFILVVFFGEGLLTIQFFQQYSDKYDIDFAIYFMEKLKKAEIKWREPTDNIDASVRICKLNYVLTMNENNTDTQIVIENVKVSCSFEHRSEENTIVTFEQFGDVKPELIQALFCACKPVTNLPDTETEEFAVLEVVGKIDEDKNNGTLILEEYFQLDIKERFKEGRTLVLKSNWLLIEDENLQLL